MAIFTSLLSAHTQTTCMWSVGCGKVIAAFNARKLELDDGAWRLDIRCIEDNFDLPLSPRD